MYVCKKYTRHVLSIALLAETSYSFPPGILMRSQLLQWVRTHYRIAPLAQRNRTTASEIPTAVQTCNSAPGTTCSIQTYTGSRVLCGASSIISTLHNGFASSAIRHLIQQSTKCKSLHMAHNERSRDSEKIAYMDAMCISSWYCTLPEIPQSQQV